MNSVLKIFISVVFLSLFSCEEYVTIHKNQLVVNEFFSANESFTVEITTARSSFDTNRFLIQDDLDVMLYENGNLLGQLEYMELPGLFTDPVFYLPNEKRKVYTNPQYLPIAGNEYEIKVIEDGTLMLTAKNTIPQSVFISRTDTFTTQSNVMGYIRPTFAFNVQFDDDADRDNYYAISLKIIDEYSDTLTVQRHSGDLICEEAMLKYRFYYKDNSGFFGEYLCFTDELMNGSTISFTFEILDVDFYFRPEITNTTAVVYLHSLSKEYYEYVKSYNMHREANEDLYSEPVRMFSNIEGGQGIFAGSTCDSDTIEIPAEIYNYYLQGHDTR